ncbi:hypothetical protein N0V84_005736 [Fusarium piperis]|uniref:Uncharacterized protein n=1 Tax=Fusarium piperis TaxID=1435070 RepID=A0A9W9BP77_9HYPO|nr:hypothetical protein N0V84_005736 [Fusarium piperis]
MCNTLDRTYEYVLPEEKKEFNTWQKLYRSPYERPQLDATTRQEASDAETEQPTEQEANFQGAYEAMTEEAVLDGLMELGDAIRGSMVPRTSLHDDSESQDDMSTSDDESTTLEDVFRLEDDEEDITPNSSLSCENVDASLDDESRLEDGITLDATSQSDDEYLSSDYTSQMDDWTSPLTDETWSCSSQPDDDCPDLDMSPHAVEENSTLDIAPRPEEDQVLDDVSRQDPIIPVTTRDRMPGILKAKLERNAVCEHLLTMMNQPSLKPTVRGTQPVPQDFQETYDDAVIQIEELKSLWYCVREMQRYVGKMKENYQLAEKDMRVKAWGYRAQSIEVLDYHLQRMKSKGQASRLNERIGIDDPWPEGE